MDTDHDDVIVEAWNDPRVMGLIIAAFCCALASLSISVITVTIARKENKSLADRIKALEDEMKDNEKTEPIAATTE